MRMIVHQDDRAVILTDAGSLLELIGIHFGHWKSLLCGAPEPTKRTDQIFARGQPISALAEIAEISEINLAAVKSLEKFWPDLRVVVHKKQRRRDVVGARPQGDCLALPFRIEKIPHRPE